MYHHFLRMPFQDAFYFLDQKLCFWIFTKNPCTFLSTIIAYTASLCLVRTTVLCGNSDFSSFGDCLVLYQQRNSLFTPCQSYFLFRCLLLFYLLVFQIVAYIFEHPLTHLMLQSLIFGKMRGPDLNSNHGNQVSFLTSCQ